MKKVVITGVRQAALVEVPDPRPVADWALVKVTVAPMCTEYKSFQDGRPNANLGHEAAGEVVGLGPRALRDLQNELGLEGGVSVGDVARFPGALERVEVIYRGAISEMNVAPITTYLLVGRIKAHDGQYDTVSLFVNP